MYRGFPDSSVGKESACNAGDPGSIPGSGTSTGEGTGSVQFSSITQSCLTLCNPMDCSTPGLSVHHKSLLNSSVYFWSLLKLMSIESMTPSNHLILCRSLLLLPSIFPSIRVLSNESALHIRWQMYWEFQLQHQSFQ